MMACPYAAPVPQPGFLIQIRRGYATDCNGLRLSVETDAEGWRAEVRNRNDGRTLYSAHRCGPGAAKIAAAEFAVFETGGAVPFKSPEALARHLSWNEYW